jgi:hypothetical protein
MIHLSRDGLGGEHAIEMATQTGAQVRVLRGADVAVRSHEIVRFQKRRRRFGTRRLIDDHGTE